MKKTSRFYFGALLVAFLTYGLFSCVHGTLATAMMSYFGTSTTDQGLISTIQYAGGLTMALIIFFFGERFNKVHAVTISLSVLALSCIAIFFAPTFGVMLCIIFFCGTGTTTLDSMGNSLLPLLYPERKHIYVPMLHSIHSTGAMVTPLLLPLLVNMEQPGTFRNGYLAIGIVGAVGILLCLLLGRSVNREKWDAVQVKNPKTVHPLKIFKSSRAWLLLAISFCQFTFNLATNSWLKYYFEHNAGVSFQLSGVVLTAFAAGALVMRFVSPCFLGKLRSTTVFALASIFAGSFMIAAILATGASVTILAILCGLAGFFNGVNGIAIYLIANEYFPTRMATASAIPMFALSIAGLTVPVVMGAISSVTGLMLPLLAASGVAILGAVVALAGFKKVPVADLIEQGH
ncbi:MFS transporter [Christensenellaceae bacterium NSJ-63]|uniref:MFS transporter n=1 Tax=Guopingia tenuis TaxID=2763656 RepID=A0A926HVN4_9FIRM|nr:MFS transporter [Guopingia tenuis]MBC8537498.1 MFS transporter [Guopingia tenuis]MBS5645222.1 MFS transporter [Clostridiales bacterium]